MAPSPKFKLIDISFIEVRRSDRQRKVIGSIQDLSDSIKRVGLINPITVTKNHVLIAGERRLEACRLISEDYKIPVRYVEDLSEVELQLLELEENLKRKGLDWKDEIAAVSTLHRLLCEVNPNWTQEKTADYLGYNYGYVSERLALSSRVSDEKVAKATNLSTARAIVKRDNDRAIDNELNAMLQIAEPESTPENKISAKIHQGDFTEICQAGLDRKFSFIHCDFPYGINHGESAQGNISGGSFSGYADGEDVYWKLIDTLCKHTESIALPSAHLMFWFSMKFYQETINYIEANSNWSLATEHPLIWMKSDNKGIVSDVTRRPRNIYETALLFSRGDRKIITPVANAYACPTSKTFHASEKPEPMLRHFFRMFIDEHSEVLDPTAGSGSAIRAAFELGAKRSIGYELDPEFAKSADGLLTRAKGLKAVSTN